MPLILAQLPPEQVLAYVLVTLAFLIIAIVVLWRVHGAEIKLILMGLVVAGAAMGYGALIEQAEALALVLMRIGVVLILCGVGCTFLAYFGIGPASAASLGTRPEGPFDETH